MPPQVISHTLFLPPCCHRKLFYSTVVSKSNKEKTYPLAHVKPHVPWLYHASAEKPSSRRISVSLSLSAGGRAVHSSALSLSHTSRQVRTAGTVVCPSRRQRFSGDGDWSSGASAVVNTSGASELSAPCPELMTAEELATHSVHQKVCAEACRAAPATPQTSALRL